MAFSKKAPQPPASDTRECNTLKIDAALLAYDFKAIPRLARELEDAGVDGVFTFEGPTEPFTPLFLAAEHTTRLELATGVAVAFARNPMVLAQLAQELAVASDGRFRLGLGSQVKAHIERRFSETWSHPHARMRELISAVRAIWRSWNEDEPLDFRGRFYTHTLMTPLFRPGVAPGGPPPLELAGVGEAMTRVAAETADSLVVHPFHSAKSLAAVTLPALTKGATEAARARPGLVCQVMAAVADDEAGLVEARSMVRTQIAFYASTKAYRSVLEAEGLAELGPELAALVRAGRWDAMADAVPASLVDAVAPSGTPEEVGRELALRHVGMADRLALAMPYPLPASLIGRLADAARSSVSS
ncbi:MAG: putative F420-dependent oxidoreductase [Hyphomicrobiaceae bacterium]|jgi:probable F420-dependent oxidoreductase